MAPLGACPTRSPGRRRQFNRPARRARTHARVQVNHASLATTAPAPRPTPRPLAPAPNVVPLRERPAPFRLLQPIAVAVDPDERIYVLDAGSGQVHKLTPAGQPL